MGLKVHWKKRKPPFKKTEEFYIDELESLKTFKKTTPKDLIYLEKARYQKDNFLIKKVENIINGIKDSKYQIGY